MTPKQQRSLVKKIEDACACLEVAQHFASQYGLSETAGRLGEAKTEAIKALREAEST